MGSDDTKRGAAGLHRRDFLTAAGSLVAGATFLPGRASAAGAGDDPFPKACIPAYHPSEALIFQPDAALPVRQRKSAYDLTPGETERLRKAYKRLRELTRDAPNDPRGWMAQANVHCWYCGGPAGNEVVAGLEIHGGWNFFPWHRAYLYFHERILGELIGDPTLALAYWNWDSVNPPPPAPQPFKMLPQIFSDPNTLNALRDTYRGATPADVMTMDQVQPTAIQKLMSTGKTELFMGYNPYGPNGGTGGAMEFGPHGVIHLWVGQPSLKNPNGVPDMGVLATASRDPIFFAHHGNIDRLWSVWMAQSTDPQNPDFQPPQAPIWSNQRYVFYDEKKRWMSMAAGDTLDTKTNLRYEYIEPGGAPVKVFVSTAAAASGPSAAAPQDAGTAAGAPVAPAGTSGGISASDATALGEVQIAKSSKGIRVTNQPVTRSTNGPKALGVVAKSFPAPGDDVAVVLHIDGLMLPPSRAANVRVFVNLPTATAATLIDDPHYAGTFTIVPMSVPGDKAHEGHRQTTKNVALQIDDVLAKVGRADGKLDVTLVPITGPGVAPTEDLQMAVQRIWVSVE